MQHKVSEERGVLVVALEGDVDMSSSPDARKVLLDCVGRGRPVVVDMAGVSYIDSSGVASLVESLQNARKSGSAFVLAAVSEPARRVLELARLDQVFTIHESRDAARAAVE